MVTHFFLFHLCKCTLVSVFLAQSGFDENITFRAKPQNLNIMQAHGHTHMHIAHTQSYLIKSFFTPLQYSRGWGCTQTAIQTGLSSLVVTCRLATQDLDSKLCGLTVLLPRLIYQVYGNRAIHIQMPFCILTQKACVVFQYELHKVHLEPLKKKK